MEKGNEKKRKVEPTLLQMSVQKIWEMDTKGVDSQQVSVSAPNPPKLCLRIRLKLVNSLNQLFPAFLCFEYSLPPPPPHLPCVNKYT
jgi:hypothetical protein